MNESAKFWITSGLALIGALAWLPTIFGSLKSNKIEGKILSQYSNVARIPNGRDSGIILQKLSLYSKNKNFYLKDIEVYLKFPNVKDELKCTLWTWRDLYFTFDEKGHKVQRKLSIETKDYLLQLTLLPKDQSIVGFLSFSFDHLKDEKYEFVRYVFIDFDGNRKTLVIPQDNISENTQIFDKKIWIEWDREAL
ncbi:MAG: hypothetical protein K9N21_13675 [Deltaproteobacteria bacterium]|nr:hypothetical protein [Deltaproteobacteria bacterium]